MVYAYFVISFQINTAAEDEGEGWLVRRKPV